MKKIISTTCIIIILSLFSGSIEAQTVNYEYDNSGNIKLRKIIVLKSSYSAPDSIVKSKIFEDIEINIRIYPNPTRGDLKIEVPDYKDSEILIFQVYDMNGRLLLNTRRSKPSSILDLSNFSNGTYILRMTRKGVNSSWRIIKTN
jgi:hypothetical protein